jgi:hypothetical protein
MWKALNKVGQTIIAAMFGLAVVSLTAFALTIPATYAPRQFQTQQTGYLRFVVQASGSGISVNGVACAAAVTAGGNCSVKIGALPYNAFVVRAYQQVTTAFNSTTTDTLGIGTATGTGNQNIVAAQTVHAGTAGLPLTVVAANLGIAATGNGIASTGANGGFDLYATFVYTGTNIATLGTAVVVIEYFSPNDGTCVDVPIGSTSVAC